MSITLPIENHPAILQEYGRAFAYINFVEVILEISLQEKGKSKRQLRGKMFGKKIELGETVLPEEIILNLKDLNKERVKLAHGITARRKGGAIIIYKKDTSVLSETSLQNITKLAKEVYGQLIKETYY